MAFTERYANFDLATGNNDGTSEANAWQTPAAVEAGVAAGDSVNIKKQASPWDLGTDGSIQWDTVHGTTTNRIRYRGYGSTIGDGVKWEVVNTGGSAYDFDIKTNFTDIEDISIDCSPGNFVSMEVGNGPGSVTRRCYIYTKNSGLSIGSFECCLIRAEVAQIVIAGGNSYNVFVRNNTLILEGENVSDYLAIIDCYSRAVFIEGNTFIDKTGSADHHLLSIYRPDFGEGGIIFNNRFYGAYSGVYFTATPGNQQRHFFIRGNVFEGNDIGVRENGSSDGRILIEQNYYYNMGTGFATNSGEWVRDNVSLSASPFVSASGNNFDINRIADAGLAVRAGGFYPLKVPILYSLTDQEKRDQSELITAEDVEASNMVLKVSATLGGDLVDLSDEGHTITNVGSIATVADKAYNGSLAFSLDGSTQYGTIADNAALSFAGTPFSVGMHVYLDNNTGLKGLLSKGVNHNDGEFNIYVNGANLNIRIIDDSTGGYIGIDLGSVHLGGWHYIGFSYDGGTSADSLVCYLDGEEFGTPAIDGTFNGVSDTTDTFYIGRRGSAYPHDGKIDTVWMFKKFLTADQHQALAAGRTGRQVTPLTTPPAIESQVTGIASQSASTDYTVPFPSGIESGDLLLVFLGRDDPANPTTSADSDLKQIFSSRLGEDHTIWAKKCDGTESGNMTFTTESSDGESINYCALRISNPGVFGIHGTYNGRTVTDSPPIPEAPRFRLENCLWLAVWFGRANMAPRISQPSGWTEVYELDDSYGYGSMSIMQKTEVSDGQESGQNWVFTTAQGDWTTLAIAIAAQDNEVTVGGGGGTPAHACIV